MLEALIGMLVMAGLTVLFYGGLFVIGQKGDSLTRRLDQAQRAEEKELLDDNDMPLPGNKERVRSLRTYHRKERESAGNYTGLVLVAFVIGFCVLVSMIYPESY